MFVDFANFIVGEFMKKQFKLILFVLVLVIFVVLSCFLMPKNMKTDIYGLFLKLLNVDVVKTDDPKYNVLKLDNDYISFSGEKEDISTYIKKLTAFSSWVQNQDIPFLYIQAPHKISKALTTLPDGNENFYNIAADDMLSAIKQSGGDVIDLRASTEYMSDFFKTDHHWTPYAGFKAAKTILSHINLKYQMNLNDSVLNIDNFESTTYKNCFLGSQGKKVGKYYVGTDDFTFLMPNFSTRLTKDVPIMGISLNGTFKDCFSDYSLFENKDVYSASPYTFYTSDYNLEIDKNLNAKDGKKILFIRDSFGCVLTPFVALGVSELHVVDTRHFKENLYSYILSNNFDLVIFESNPGFNQSQFTFIKQDKIK